MRTPTLPLCLALMLALPAIPGVAASDTCTPVGPPCVPVQRQYDDLVGNNLDAVSEANVGWLNLDPGNVRFQPLLDLPANLAANTVDFADALKLLADGTAAAVLGDLAGSEAEATTWVLATVGEVPDRATASAIAFANAGDAILTVTVTEAGTWVAFVNAAGVTLASATVSAAESAPGSLSAVTRAADGSGDYLGRKATQAIAHLVDWLANPPTEAAQRDVDENGLGDTWEDTVCRSRLGAPGLPPDACALVDSNYRMARAYATADFDYDGLGLIDEYRWNSDPLDADTDGDGLPDGPEANLWRRAENDLVVNANLWTCPAGPSFDGASACAWRHPDSFRDDDGDGYANMGQDAAGALAVLGAGDKDSENDGLLDGDEYYGCHTDPVYGANPHADPGIPGFDLCGGPTVRGHETDALEPDTDGDGLHDVQEVCSATGGACSRSASYDTDPQAFDTDGDAWKDGDEAAFWRTAPGGWFNDLDHDGLVNNLDDPDSDRDGIQDGVEWSSGTGIRPDRWDTDGDGMPDPWELRNRLNPTDPSDAGVMDPHECRDKTAHGDADQDGLCNLFEYAFQRPSYWDEASDGEWTSILNPHEPDMDGDQLPDGKEILPGSTPYYFSRLAMQPPGSPGAFPDGRYDYGWNAAYPGYAGSTRIDLVDTDGDGLTDAYEHDTRTSFGTYTDPNQADSDQDGLPDARETATDPADWDTDNDGIADGSEPATCGNLNDCDHDGLQDGDEGDCNPNDADKDHDNLNDGQERAAGTDCNDDDSDGDGLNDFDEVRTYGTNPNNGDSDGDGLGDRDEVRGTPNAWHTARHATLGQYSYGTDRCVSANPACATDGATDPMDWDSDNDTVSDGAEVHTARLSTLCSGGCAFTYTNPNRADTDGDGFDDYQESFRHCYGGVVGLDMTNFDMDGDFLGDRDEYEVHQSNACDPDTDDDRLEDGAEVAFGSLPTEWSSDTDSISDLHDARPLVDDEAPLIIGVLRPNGPDYRAGACIRVTDGDTVSVAEVNVHFYYDGGVINHWFRDPGAATPYDVAHPSGWRWQGFGADEAICLSWSQGPPGDPNGFNVTFEDRTHNRVTIEVGLHTPRKMDYVHLILTVVCFATAGGSQPVAAGVEAAGAFAEGFEVGYDAGSGHAFDAVVGAVELGAAKVAEMEVNGKALAPTLGKVLSGPVGCIIDAAFGDFYIDGTPELRELTLRSTDATPVRDYFWRPGASYFHPTALAKPVTPVETRTLSGGGATATAYRGDGYALMRAHYPTLGYTDDQWHTRIQEVLTNNAVTTVPIEYGKNYFVYTALMDSGQWDVYVYKGSAYDGQTILYDVIIH